VAAYIKLFSRKFTCAAVGEKNSLTRYWIVQWNFLNNWVNVKFSRTILPQAVNGICIKTNWRKKSFPFPLPKSKFQQSNTTKVRSRSSDFWWNYFQTECHNASYTNTRLFVRNKTSGCIELTITTLRKKLNMANSLPWCSLWNTKGSTPIITRTDTCSSPVSVEHFKEPLNPFLPISEISQTADFCAMTPSIPCVSNTVPTKHAAFVCIWLRKSRNLLCKVWYFISERIHLIFLLPSLAT
jgi:hypothetical protein